MLYTPNEVEGNPTYFFDEEELEKLLEDGDAEEGDHIYEVKLLHIVRLEKKLVLESV